MALSTSSKNRVFVAVGIHSMILPWKIPKGAKQMIRLIVLALVILLVVLAVTNPGQEAHKKVVYESIAASKTNSEVLGKIAADVLGNADVVPMTYNNYYLLSTTTVQGQTASVGVCSRVWKMK